MKPLNKLTQDECFLIHKEMLENSNIRWNSAKLLAKNKDYGGAINSHITSMEEMIKSLIMLLDYKGFEFRTVDGMDTVIRRSHSIRHFIGFTMFVLNIFMADFMKFLSKSKNNPSFLISLLKNNGSKMELFIKWYFLRKIPLIKKEFYWFSKIESFRQSGNHVDIDSSFKSPLKITKEDYLEVYSRLNNVKTVINELIKMFSNEDVNLNKQIRLMKTKIKNENLYKLLQDSMISVTKERKNPFDIVAKSFAK